MSCSCSFRGKPVCAVVGLIPPGIPTRSALAPHIQQVLVQQEARHRFLRALWFGHTLAHVMATTLPNTAHPAFVSEERPLVVAIA